MVLNTNNDSDLCDNERSRKALADFEDYLKTYGGDEELARQMQEHDENFLFWYVEYCREYERKLVSESKILRYANTSISKSEHRHQIVAILLQASDWVGNAEMIGRWGVKPAPLYKHMRNLCKTNRVERKKGSRGELFHRIIKGVTKEDLLRDVYDLETLKRKKANAKFKKPFQ